MISLSVAVASSSCTPFSLLPTHVEPRENSVCGVNGELGVLGLGGVDSGLFAILGAKNSVRLRHQLRENAFSFKRAASDGDEKRLISRSTALSSHLPTCRARSYDLHCRGLLAGRGGVEAQPWHRCSGAAIQPAPQDSCGAYFFETTYDTSQLTWNKLIANGKSDWDL